jgi:hypothetical protein
MTTIADDSIFSISSLCLSTLSVAITVVSTGVWRVEFITNEFQILYIERKRIT